MGIVLLTAPGRIPERGSRYRQIAVLGPLLIVSFSDP